MLDCITILNFKIIEYFCINGGTKNPNSVAVVTAGSWSGGPCAAQPGRQYRLVLLLYISVALMYISLKHCHNFQAVFLAERLLS